MTGCGEADTPWRYGECAFVCLCCVCVYFKGEKNERGAEEDEEEEKNKKKTRLILSNVEKE